MSENIQERIRWRITQLNDPYLDGFNKFEAKKELWEMKWEIDTALRDSPSFSIEQEWLDSRINTSNTDGSEDC